MPYGSAPCGNMLTAASALPGQRRYKFTVKTIFILADFGAFLNCFA